MAYTYGIANKKKSLSEFDKSKKLELFGPKFLQIQSRFMQFYRNKNSHLQLHVASVFFQGLALEARNHYAIWKDVDSFYTIVEANFENFYHTFNQGRRQGGEAGPPNDMLGPLN